VAGLPGTLPGTCKPSLPPARPAAPAGSVHMAGKENPYPADEGECVICRDGGGRVYICRVSGFREDKSGERWILGRWYYRPEETERGRLPSHGRDELFSSNRVDIAPCSSISGKCMVVGIAEYLRLVREHNNQRVSARLLGTGSGGSGAGAAGKPRDPKPGNFAVRSASASTGGNLTAAAPQPTNSSQPGSSSSGGGGGGGGSADGAGGVGSSGVRPISPSPFRASPVLLPAAPPRSSPFVHRFSSCRPPVPRISAGPLESVCEYSRVIWSAVASANQAISDAEVASAVSGVLAALTLLVEEDVARNDTENFEAQKQVTARRPAGGWGDASTNIEVGTLSVFFSRQGYSAASASFTTNRDALEFYRTKPENWFRCGEWKAPPLVCAVPTECRQCVHTAAATASPSLHAVAHGSAHLARREPRLSTAGVSAAKQACGSAVPARHSQTQGRRRSSRRHTCVDGRCRAQERRERRRPRRRRRRRGGRGGCCGRAGGQRQQSSGGAGRAHIARVTARWRQAEGPGWVAGPRTVTGVGARQPVGGQLPRHGEGQPVGSRRG
jgi:hypothetical protein